MLTTVIEVHGPSSISIRAFSWRSFFVMIESEKVIADAQATAALVRERLMSILVRVSGLCEGRTARDIEEILEDAINDVLKSFQKSEYIT